MAEHLHVASRKGLLDFAQTGHGWALDRTSFLGEPVSAVLHDPRDGTLYAALALGHFGVKLHRSGDGGRNWSEISAPAYPPSGAEPERADDNAASLDLIWTLAPGGPDEPGTIWAGTIPGGLFRSDDRGESWTLNTSLWDQPARAQWFGGGYDNPGIHSICVDPRDSRRLTVGVSCGGVWTSGDGGQSWALGGSGLRAEYVPPGMDDDRAIQDPHRLAPCPGAPDVIWCQHHNGIFRSSDGGASFTEIENARPSAFGFAVAVHPDDPDTAWFVPAVKDECRVPVDHRLVVSRTRDGGRSFDVLGDGFPDPPVFDLVYRHAFDVDAGGTRLAMGSTTGNLWLGEDGGEHWTRISANLPPVNQVLWTTAA